MQQVKSKFHNPDKSKYGSLQSCIRTNDFDLIGDGTHLSYFEMLGNFSFGGNDYECSVEMWDRIIRELKIRVSAIHYHPDRLDHRILWDKKGYVTVPNEECVWSDGEIGGNCCEVFVGDLEVGNLVNPQGCSTDVGFGFERLIQVLEGKSRVDQTSLFRQDVHPIVSDHIRTLDSFYKNGIKPGVKGRNFICQKLLRRLMKYYDNSKELSFGEWLELDKLNRNKKLIKGLSLWPKYHTKPPKFWWETFGISEEDLEKIKNESINRG